MRLPRVRFTARRLMVAVAIAGLMLGTWDFCRRRAARFDELSQSHWDRYIELHHHGKLSESESRRTEASIRWHAVLCKKYALAADHPWLPVAPDPPEPE